MNAEDFTSQIECSYKGEKYSVRDNGEVFRHNRPDKRERKHDNQWTFGKPNDETGYMEIASERVHLIVATAFHGARSTKEFVVDHIDTNRRNNRVENLRWMTRLENAMNNPVTRKKIEYVCGCTVEEFLANPSKYRDKFQEQNFSWMRTVSAEEAKACLENMQAWAKSKKIPSGGSLGEWVFKPVKDQTQELPIEAYQKPSTTIPSKTENAIQRNWKTPSEFPCCPQTYEGNPILAYAENLKPGLLLCHNELYSSAVLKTALVNDDQAIYVMTESEHGLKRWALAKITFEDDVFVHESIQNFFSQIGAEKQFTLAQGLEWNGEDSIDDYC
jgi:HNH endonuclease